MILDTDIDSLSPRDAREYVLHFITSLKQTQAQRRQLAGELAGWRRRVALAAEQKKPELQEQARLRVDELSQREAELAEEDTVLMVKVGVLKEKLAALRLRGELKVDPDALLAELQTLSGPRDRLAEDLKEEEASQMLSELKRRLENENP